MSTMTPSPQLSREEQLAIWLEKKRKKNSSSTRKSSLSSGGRTSHRSSASCCYPTTGGASKGAHRLRHPSLASQTTISAASKTPFSIRDEKHSLVAPRHRGEMNQSNGSKQQLHSPLSRSSAAPKPLSRPKQRPGEGSNVSVRRTLSVRNDIEKPRSTVAKTKDLVRRGDRRRDTGTDEIAGGSFIYRRKGLQSSSRNEEKGKYISFRRGTNCPTNVADKNVNAKADAMIGIVISADTESHVESSFSSMSLPASPYSVSTNMSRCSDESVASEGREETKPCGSQTLIENPAPERLTCQILHADGRENDAACKSDRVELTQPRPDTNMADTATDELLDWRRESPEEAATTKQRRKRRTAPCFLPAPPLAEVSPPPIDSAAPIHVQTQNHANESAKDDKVHEQMSGSEDTLITGDLPDGAVEYAAVQPDRNNGVKSDLTFNVPTDILRVDEKAILEPIPEVNVAGCSATEAIRDFVDVNRFRECQKENIQLRAEVNELRIRNKKLENQLHSLRRSFEERVTPFRDVFQENKDLRQVNHSLQLAKQESDANVQKIVDELTKQMNTGLCVAVSQKIELQKRLDEVRAQKDDLERQLAQFADRNIA